MGNGRGRRTFVAGAIVLIVFGSIHLLAVYDALFVARSTRQELAAEAALKAVVLPMGPLKPTAQDAVNILNASYSVLLLFVGVVNLLCWRAMAAAGRLGRLALVNLIFTAIVAIIPMLAQFPPPAVLGTIAAALFLWSWMAQRAAAAGYAGAISGERE